MRQSSQLAFPFNPTQQDPTQMASFESILNKKADDIKLPPTLPQGSYQAILIGLPEQIESSQKKTPGLRFNLKIVAPLDDVDPDALSEFEGGVSGKMVRYDMWSTENPIYFENNLKSLLVNSGIDMAGKSLGEGIDEVPNREVTIYIKHEPSLDGQRVNARVSRTLAPRD